MPMTRQDHARLAVAVALSHAAGAQGYTLTAAHAAGVTIPTRPGRAGWAARWADRVADEVLAHLALTESEAALRAYEAYEATRTSRRSRKSGALTPPARRPAPARSWPSRRARPCPTPTGVCRRRGTSSTADPAPAQVRVTNLHNLRPHAPRRRCVWVPSFRHWRETWKNTQSSTGSSAMLPGTAIPCRRRLLAHSSKR